MPKYQKITHNIHSIDIDNPRTKEKIKWINISSASKKELEYLRKNYNFELAHLEASSPRVISHRPKIQKANDYLFLVIQFPVFAHKHIVAGEVDFFIGKDYVITLHNDIKPINELFSRLNKDLETSLVYKYDRPVILVYEILSKLTLGIYDHIDRFSESIDRIESLIFKDKQKEAVSELLDLRRNVINTKKIMQNHDYVVTELMHQDKSFKLHAEEEKFYEHLLEDLTRVNSNLEHQKQLVEILNSTNESVLNYQISSIMKTLTIISVITYPLALLAAIFGMNVIGGMPLMSNPKGFHIIILVMLICCLSMVLFFKKKKWF